MLHASSQSHFAGYEPSNVALAPAMLIPSLPAEMTAMPSWSHTYVLKACRYVATMASCVESNWKQQQQHGRFCGDRDATQATERSGEVEGLWTHQGLKAQIQDGIGAGRGGMRHAQNRVGDVRQQIRLARIVVRQGEGVARHHAAARWADNACRQVPRSRRAWVQHAGAVRHTCKAEQWGSTAGTCNAPRVAIAPAASKDTHAAGRHRHAVTRQGIDSAWQPQQQQATTYTRVPWSALQSRNSSEVRQRSCQ